MGPASKEPNEMDVEPSSQRQSDKIGPSSDLFYKQ